MKEPKTKGRRVPASTRGGKALQRLHQFEQERGLEETDIEHPEPREALPDKDKKPTDG